MRLFAKGDRVTQPNYGPGTVTEVNAFKLPNRQCKDAAQTL
jgi:hypothetical protein